MKKAKPHQPESAFTLESDDRFHCIVVSSPVRYAVDPDAETIITFFVIRRASGLIDIFHVLKTWKSGSCVSKNVQSKLSIPETKITTELEAIREHFSKGIQDATGLVIRWNELDLSTVSTRYEQMRRIHAWGGLRVWMQSDISLN